MPLNVPNDFIPQTQQTISSTQVDQNFAAVEAWGNALENQVLGSSGNQDTITTQKTFTQWPVCTSVAVPTASNLITRAVLDLIIPIGSMVWFPVPKLPAASYGIEYKWLNGQQLDLATYQALYDYLTVGVSPATDGVGIVAGSSPQRFTLPDWTGCQMMAPNTIAGLGASRIDAGRSDMTLLGSPSGLVGSQGITITPGNLPIGVAVRPYNPTSLFPSGNLGSGGVTISEVASQTAANFSPFSRIAHPAIRAK